MYKIEDVCNPQIGQHYLVKCVLTKRWNERPANREDYVIETYDRQDCWFPVLDIAHKDGIYGQPNSHYHVDWRFVLEQHIEAQERAFKHLYPRFQDAENLHYFAPVMETEVVKEEYIPLLYKRHFREFPQSQGFNTLKDIMKDVQMKNMKCPHHNYDMKSCQVIDGIVTCPMHGLQWNVNTGKLVI
jgi:hypothetical protein